MVLAGQPIASELRDTMTAQRRQLTAGGQPDIAMAQLAKLTTGGLRVVIKSTDDVITLIAAGMAIAAIIFDLYS